MSENESWFALEVTVKNEISEAIEFALNELNSLGNEISIPAPKTEQDLCVIGYFHKKLRDVKVTRQIHQALDIYDFAHDKVIKTKWKRIKNQDWLAEWKKHWKPTETDKFIVAPAWENVKSDEKFVIEIEPGMAFGTGTHETTRLCLRAIEKYYVAGMSFFDVGTGTGILSIAVAKFSENNAPEIHACDIDPDAIKIARENAEINQTTGIEFFTGSIEKETKRFDFICANVTADIIIPMLPLLIEKAKHQLVLSGILVEQEKEVLEELEKFGVSDYSTEIDGEWISVLVSK